MATSLNTTRISHCFDVRKMRSDGTYRVWLQVNHDGKRYFVSIKAWASPNDYKAYCEDNCRTMALKRFRDEMDKHIKKANAICEELGQDFTIEQFKLAMRGKAKKKDAVSFFDYWQSVCDQKRKEGAEGTAGNYEDAMKKFKQFKKNLDYRDLKVEFFKEFERWMLEPYKDQTEKKRKARVSVGIYARAARTVINKAIADGKMRKVKIFGKNLYSIPGRGKTLNKWATVDDLRQVFNYPAVGRQMFNRDMFQFMYRCCGIYPSDVVFMKWENLHESKITGKQLIFSRRKTENTDEDNVEIVVNVTPAIQAIIDRWGVKSKNEYDSDPFMFGLINRTMDDKKRRAKQRDLTAAINKFLNVVSEDLDLPHMSAKTARHSWAQHQLQAGTPIQKISRGLGHKNIETTMIYLGTMNTEDAKQLSSVTDWE